MSIPLFIKAADAACQQELATSSKNWGAVEAARDAAIAVAAKSGRNEQLVPMIDALFCAIRGYGQTIQHNKTKADRWKAAFKLTRTKLRKCYESVTQPATIAEMEADLLWRLGEYRAPRRERLKRDESRHGPGIGETIARMYPHCGGVPKSWLRNVAKLESPGLENRTCDPSAYYTLALGLVSDKRVEIVPASEQTEYEMLDGYKPRDDVFRLMLPADAALATPAICELSQIPPLDCESGTWVTNTQAAKLGGIKTRSLAKYRNTGNTADDGMSGIDCDGRQWRRRGTRQSHPWYLRKSLRDCEQKP